MNEVSEKFHILDTRTRRCMVVVGNEDIKSSEGRFGVEREKPAEI